MAACEDDGDCPGPQVCYTNLTWTPAPLCGCSHYYGGEGPNCAELSVQSYINASLVGIAMGCIVVILILTLATDVRIAFVRYRVFAFDNTVSFLAGQSTTVINDLGFSELDLGVYSFGNVVFVPLEHVCAAFSH